MQKMLKLASLSLWLIRVGGAKLIVHSIVSHLLVSCLLSLCHCFRNRCISVSKKITPNNRFNSVDTNAKIVVAYPDCTLNTPRYCLDLIF